MSTTSDQACARDALTGSQGLFFTPVVGLTASRILFCDSPAITGLLVHLCLVAGADSIRQRYLLELAIGHLPPSTRMRSHLERNGTESLLEAAAAEVVRHRAQGRANDVEVAIRRVLELVAARPLPLGTGGILGGRGTGDDERAMIEQIRSWVRAHSDEHLPPIIDGQRSLVDAAIAAQRIFARRLLAAPLPVIDWQDVSTDDFSVGRGDDDIPKLEEALTGVAAVLDQIPQPSAKDGPVGWPETVVRRLEPLGARAKIEEVRSSINSPGSPLEGADLNLLSELAWHMLRVTHPIPASPRELGLSLELGIAGSVRGTRLPPSSTGAVAHTGQWFATRRDPREKRLDSLVAAVAHQQLPLDQELAPIPPVIDWMATQLADIWDDRELLGSKVLRPLAISTAFDLTLEASLLTRGPCHSLFPVLISDESQKRRPVLIWALALHEPGRPPEEPHFLPPTDRNGGGVPGVTRHLTLDDIRGPLVIRLVGSPLIRLDELQEHLGKSTPVQHMVAVGEYEALTLGPSLAALEGEGTKNETLSLSSSLSPTLASAPKPSTHWQELTANAQVAPVPSEIRRLIRGRASRAAASPQGDRGGSEERERAFRDWVFVGQSLSDWSFRSQMYFLPTSQWGAQAHKKPFDDGLANLASAKVFDWDVGPLEHQFLEKLGITPYTCDLDELFEQEVGR